MSRGIRAALQPDRSARERGQIGGIEAIWFGVVVFVGGILFVASAWGVVDAKLAATAAAREAARVLVESDPADAVGRARAAAQAVLVEHGRRSEQASISITGALHRCGMAVVEVAYPVPSLAIPGVAGAGPTLTVRARHAERMDPYRSGPAGAADCGYP